ncbi:MAG: hypothetical protein KF778_03135 [Rhodocyclaceae bacterium]|nr:hypothetical protein [Rhodocyclaceae bacterium]MBX3667372.1 hypothetical protein [Rhodocyclaceae bacterium]
MDWDHFDRLYPNRPGFVDKLTNIFMLGHAADAERLRTVAAAADYAGIAALAHELKSLGGNLCSPAVEKLALRTQRSARENRPAACLHATELAAKVDMLIAALRKGRPAP